MNNLKLKELSLIESQLPSDVFYAKEVAKDQMTSITGESKDIIRIKFAKSDNTSFTLTDINDGTIIGNINSLRTTSDSEINTGDPLSTTIPTELSITDIYTFRNAVGVGYLTNRNEFLSESSSQIFDFNYYIGMNALGKGTQLEDNTPKPIFLVFGAPDGFKADLLLFNDEIKIPMRVTKMSRSSASTYNYLVTYPQYLFYNKDDIINIISMSFTNLGDGKIYYGTSNCDFIKTESQQDYDKRIADSLINTGDTISNLYLNTTMSNTDVVSIIDIILPEYFSYDSNGVTKYFVGRKVIYSDELYNECREYDSIWYEGYSTTTEPAAYTFTYISGDITYYFVGVSLGLNSEDFETCRQDENNEWWSGASQSNAGTLNSLISVNHVTDHSSVTFSAAILACIVDDNGNTIYFVGDLSNAWFIYSDNTSILPYTAAGFGTFEAWGWQPPYSNGVVSILESGDNATTVVSVDENQNIWKSLISKNAFFPNYLSNRRIINNDNRNL